MKTVAEHDEGMKIISSANYVEYFHAFKTVLLTENWLLNMRAQSNDATTIGKNVSDIYTDSKFQQQCENYDPKEIPHMRTPDNISLNHFASHFSNMWVPLDKPKEPHPTPNFKYVPKLGNSKYTALLPFHPISQVTLTLQKRHSSILSKPVHCVQLWCVKNIWGV